MKILILILVSITFIGCKNNVYEEERAMPVLTDSISSKPEIYNLYLNNTAYILNEYEPKDKKYLGIFLEENEGDFIKAFEKDTDTKHSIYSYNLKFGEPFPLSWVLNCYSNYKTPFINILPPDDFRTTFDLSILEKMSKEFGNLKIPIFVNFYPVCEKISSSPEAYISFFKEAKTYFDMNASNVAFIWSVNSDFAYISEKYYPGDSYTDWVGLNIYEDITKENKLENVLQELEYFYKQYQTKKPIALSNLAISHFSNSSFDYKIQDKIAELNRFYKIIPYKYPMIKMINYVNYDNLKTNDKNKQNYSLTDNRDILKAYKSIIKDEIFSETVTLNAKNRNCIEKIKLPFVLYKKDETFYLEKNIINSLGHENLINKLTSYFINGNYLYRLDEFSILANLRKSVDEINKNIVLSEN